MALYERIYFAEPSGPLMSEPILSLYKSPVSGNKLFDYLYVTIVSKQWLDI